MWWIFWFGFEKFQAVIILIFFINIFYFFFRHFHYLLFIHCKQSVMCIVQVTLAKPHNDISHFTSIEDWLFTTQKTLRRVFNLVRLASQSCKKWKYIISLSYLNILDNSVHERRFRILGLSNSNNTRDIHASENKVYIK